MSNPAQPIETQDDTLQVTFNDLELAFKELKQAHRRANGRQSAIDGCRDTIRALRTKLAAAASDSNVDQIQLLTRKLRTENNRLDRLIEAADELDVALASSMDKFMNLLGELQ